MVERYVSLEKINDVKDFVEIVSRFDYKAEIVSDTYILSAKSIMGIYSLDLTEPLKLRVHADNCDDLLADIATYLRDEKVK